MIRPHHGAGYNSNSDDSRAVVLHGNHKRRAGAVATDAMVRRGGGGGNSDWTAEFHATSTRNRELNNRLQTVERRLTELEVVANQRDMSHDDTDLKDRFKKMVDVLQKRSDNIQAFTIKVDDESYHEPQKDTRGVIKQRPQTFEEFCKNYDAGKGLYYEIRTQHYTMNNLCLFFELFLASVGESKKLVEDSDDAAPCIKLWRKKGLDARGSDFHPVVPVPDRYSQFIATLERAVAYVENDNSRVLSITSAAATMAHR